MNLARFTTYLALLSVCLLLIYSCKREQDEPAPPVIITFGPSAIGEPRSTTTAFVSSTLTSAPTGQALTVGYVWSKMNAQPTLTDNKTTQTLSLTALPASLTTTLTGLDNGATYYARAYVTVGSNTTYGPVVSFQMNITLARLFAQALTDSLQNKDIGYGFTIFQGNTLAASGTGGFQSRTTDPEGQRPYTIDSKMHMASMSKTLTAMAFVQLMAQKGIRSTDRIAAYLPPSWPKGPNVDQITFRELLTHRSGIIGLGNNCVNGAFSENIYTGLKQLIAKGVTAANRGQYCYQNANVGLFRVLIPALTGYTFTGTDATDDQQTQQRYVAYIQQNVLEKVGLTNIVPTFPSGNITYGYSYPHTGAAGWNPGNFSSTVGAYGWYMTPREAGTLYATVLSSPDQSVLSTAFKDSLLLNNMGCFRISSNLGNFAYHDGWWYFNNIVPYYGFRTIWMKLPDNMTVVLFTNALHRQTGRFPSNDGTDITTFVARAYSRARQANGGRLPAVTFTLEHPEPH
ncbi:serine hydrolase domain-containing protein [Spirosoma montaniterrae]|uniref:Serine hydrolase n=1 Tax=Spirosoma montaniterrae TaxID=1178516 RepID=A0A1P9WX10_9BACT|nr:serine hydrolase domain-containing protein [Spirosoma montaniterrae]AQG79925.1 serine hydrolase [Spirosoma montaniterrae]